MTKLLEKAFREASSLPDTLQDLLAQELVDEIEWEKKWDSTLENSQGLLDSLADKAKKEFKEGKTLEQGFDEL